MKFCLTILDDNSNILASLNISEIAPMYKISGIGGRLALHSTLFDSIEAYKKECREHIGDFNFYNPDSNLYIPILQDKFFYFFCKDNGISRRGILKSDGKIIAYSNFDDALILSDNFLLIKKESHFGFINAEKSSTSSIEYKKLDLQPTQTLDSQNSNTKLAAIASKTIENKDYYGALDEAGNVLIPFEYTRIEYHVNYVIVEYMGDKAKVHISELNALEPIKLTPSNDETYYDDYDPDPWGANDEMDYIRNNGGDWIDD